MRGDVHGMLVMGRLRDWQGTQARVVLSSGLLMLCSGAQLITEPDPVKAKQQDERKRA